MLLAAIDGTTITVSVAAVAGLITLWMTQRNDNKKLAMELKIAATKLEVSANAVVDDSTKKDAKLDAIHLAVNGNLKAAREEVTDLKKEIEPLKGKIGSLNGEIDSLKVEITALKNVIAAVGVGTKLQDTVTETAAAAVVAKSEIARDAATAKQELVHDAVVARLQVVEQAAVVAKQPVEPAKV